MFALRTVFSENILSYKFAIRAETVGSQKISFLPAADAVYTVWNNRAPTIPCGSDFVDAGDGKRRCYKPCAAAVGDTVELYWPTCYMMKTPLRGFRDREFSGSMFVMYDETSTANGWSRSKDTVLATAMLNKAQVDEFWKQFDYQTFVTPDYTAQKDGQWMSSTTRDLLYLCAVGLIVLSVASYFASTKKNNKKTDETISEHPPNHRLWI